MRSGKKAQSMLQADVPLKGKWCPFAVGMALLLLIVSLLLSISLRSS